jgi:hypothetical protein
MRQFIDIVEAISANSSAMYQHGRCMYFALALHDLAGWPIYGEIAQDGRIIHAWASDDGKAVDINGVHSSNFAEPEGPDKRGGVPTKVKQLNPERLRAKYVGDMPEVLNNAKTLILAHSDHFGLGKL